MPGNRPRRRKRTNRCLRHGDSFCNCRFLSRSANVADGNGDATAETADDEGRGRRLILVLFVLQVTKHYQFGEENERPREPIKISCWEAKP